MVADREYIDWVMERLGPIGNITEKAMFGGFGVFSDGVMFGLVSKQSALYFKADDSNRQLYEDAGSHR